jgi:hypothetical protein
MGRRKKKARSLAQIRVTVGAVKHTFLLQNETLVSRVEAMQRMREIRLAVEQGGVSEPPKTIPSPESVDRPEPHEPDSPAASFEVISQDQDDDFQFDDWMDVAES